MIILHPTSLNQPYASLRQDQSQVKIIFITNFWSTSPTIHCVIFVPYITIYRPIKLLFTPGKIQSLYQCAKQMKTQQYPHHTDPLTYVLCKIYERMVTTRLNYYLESNNILHPQQSGFRKGKSTANQLIRLHTAAVNSINTHGYTRAVLLYLTKAFVIPTRRMHQTPLFNIKSQITVVGELAIDEQLSRATVFAS